MYNYVQMSMCIHIKCAFIYDSFFQLYMFCHILRSVKVRLGQARALTGEWPITYPFSTQTDRYQSLEVFGERIVAAANGGRWDVNAHSMLHSMLHAVTLDQWAPGGGFVDCIGTFCLTSSRSSYTPQVSMTSYCHHLRIYGS